MMYLGLLQAQVGEDGCADVGKFKELIRRKREVAAATSLRKYAHNRVCIHPSTVFEDQPLNNVYRVALPGDAGQA
jgi:hypothetical protein